ncbi:meiotic nuclear division protein 1 [Crucibulum laeve]|uniref:Meiotic nuclear division protein 1 n=1 Tax=Crucibulum laeve TaxID=68775 RepID=A0A5C3MHN7_9AGAR|nr:meiotic nuclear division protein 1 [Crucibulum laeve]
MAPRGLSAEEKRVKLLEIFHETKDFYQLKELEKLGPKMKGIVSQSIKDVLQSLVDDGLVQGDKIGSSNFFWSFPSQSGALAQSRLQTVKEARVGYQQQLTDLKTAIELERTARPASELRSQSIEKLSALRQNLISLQTELDAYGDSDPRKVEEAKRAAFLAKEAALRWTDNYGVLLGYFTRQSGIEVAEIRKFLGIEEDYEDIY